MVKKHLSTTQRVTIDEAKDRYNYYMSQSQFGMAERAVNKIRKTGKGTQGEAYINRWCNISEKTIKNRKYADRHTQV